MNDKVDVSKYWQEIEEDLFVVKADGLEDFRAVMGAKTSRASDLNVRANIDSEGLEKFLKMNLAGYGHASIGEMAFPTVHHRGFGWVGAWLVEDDPLFVGQEVSTRAVDMRQIPKASEICYDAPIFLKKQHDFFWNIFNELDKQNQETKGYKYDQIRWALPGTTKLGVTCMMNARAAMRQLERISSLPFARKISEKFMKGIQNCAPFVYDALVKGQRTVPHRWTKMDKIKIIKKTLDFHNSIKIEGPTNLENMEIFKNMMKVAPRKRKDYLDPAFKTLTPFKVTIICSIASARDWHRHRPVMPWTIKMVEDENGHPFIAPWYEMKNVEGVQKEISNYIVEGYSKVQDIMNSENSYQALYFLPYGALVSIECHASLPDLLYMFELRAAAGGNNFEYKAHALEGIKQLTEIMGSPFTTYHSLDNVLKNS